MAAGAGPPPVCTGAKAGGAVDEAASGTAAAAGACGGGVRPAQAGESTAIKPSQRNEEDFIVA
jgi:hypothetical protein